VEVAETAMSFREHLQDVCKCVDGALACSLMGLDGIEVETHVQAGVGDVDLKSLLVEYSGVFQSARTAADVHQAGGISEVSINTDKLVTVARLVSPDYFMVVALTPEGNYGKARYLLRITAPKVRSEL
jgi:predicted regulator of Ras-like GTPase activity (Roadblock/LC7/MglB family)